MRASKLAPPPAPPTALRGPGGWSGFGVHGLRLVDGSLLDFPLPVPAGASCWVATVWPDHRSPTGWAAQAWPPDQVGGRGWRWPPRIAVGDVVEFGVDKPAGRRRVVSTRWWGVIAAYDGSWMLSVQGPHLSPAHASEAAGRLIQDRCCPLPEPPGLPAEPSPKRDPAGHRGRVRTHRS